MKNKIFVFFNVLLLNLSLVAQECKSECLNQTKFRQSKLEDIIFSKSKAPVWNMESKDFKDTILDDEWLSDFSFEESNIKSFKISNLGKLYELYNQNNISSQVGFMNKGDLIINGTVYDECENYIEHNVETFENNKRVLSIKSYWVKEGSLLQVIETKYANSEGFEFISSKAFVDQSKVDRYPAVDVSLHPNPTHDKIKFKINNEKNYTVNIYNLNGKLIASVISKNNNCKVDVSTYPIGTYIAIFKNDSKTIIAKQFVKM